MEGAAHLMWWLLMKKKTVFLNALLHLKYLFLWKIINTDSQHKPTSNSITICEWWYENSLRIIKLILKNKIKYKDGNASLMMYKGKNEVYMY
jgi:hypothetical protein